MVLKLLLAFQVYPMDYCKCICRVTNSLTVKITYIKKYFIADKP